MTHVYAYDHQHDLPLPELKTLIGSKAANLAVMVNELGLPVPPAFTIATATCRTYLADGWPADLDAELREHLARVEMAVGRRFGDPSDPLLVSVRSGAPVSMPGMMDTILNLGLNDATTEGLARATGDPAFAADCRRRFEQMYRDIVGVADVPGDPWAQLRGAIEAVFRSWNSDRARAYRAHEGIDDDLGTGVTIQAMVFGNLGTDSGTGVLFTRDPSTGVPELYGDIMFGAQGEDVVAGTHHTEPIAVLDERMPAVAAELRAVAAALERHYADLCDIEFTIERGRLWMLQVRVGKRSPQAALRMAIDMAEDPDFPLDRAGAVYRVARLLADPPLTVTERQGAPALATGLGASPGVACGEIAVTPDSAVAAAEAGRSVILVRNETSPDDVHGMARAAGILTATGGFASHAAVVARGWGIPAVVGAAAVAPNDGSVTIGERHLAPGDLITIDGGTGEVFEGSVLGSCDVVPEAATLLAWAEQLGIAVDEAQRADAGMAAAGEPVGAGGPTTQPRSDGRLGDATAGEGGDMATEAPGTGEAPGVDEALRMLLIKGYATPESAAPALACSVDAAGALLDRLVADGLAEIAVGSFRLTDDGKVSARELLGADAAAWGAERANAALDGFVELDHRMKEIVTAWQMREIDGVQAFNDHSDAVYDAQVLARFGELHADASAWLLPQVASLPRLGRYARRLEAAATAARAGDGRFIASPRVDSYHGVWFELHEELILLSGRNRADEVAAGRA